MGETGRVAADGEDAFLRLDGLGKRFGDVEAVRSVDLSVAEGEFLTLLGPSGCGKSTLLRMIGGFEQPSGGRVLLRGEDLTAAVPEGRPFNMVFQSYALFPHMSVAENVGYGPRIAGDSRDGRQAPGRGRAEPRPPAGFRRTCSGGVIRRSAAARSAGKGPGQ